MAIVQNKIYKSITLQPGEQFILPPGAVISSSTSIAATQSSCNDIGDLEELECYTFVFGNAEEDGGEQQLFEDETFPVTGISVNGNYSDFPTPFFATKDNGSYDLNGIVQAINNKLGGILINPSIGEHGEGDHGKISFITFKTIPSLAKNIELRMIAATDEGFNVDEGIQLWIKPRPTEDLSAYSGVPACS